MFRSIQILGLIALGHTLPGHATAENMSGPRVAVEMIRIAAVAEDAPQSALDDIDALLDLAGIHAIPTNRPQFDLLLMRAQLLAELGHKREAALIFAELAHVAESNGAKWHDPVTLFDQAAQLFEQAGNLGFARREVIAKMRFLRASTASEAEMSAARAERERLTTLMGNDPAMPLSSGGNAAPLAAAPSIATPPDGAAESSGRGFHTVDVYYGTDRARSGKTRPAEFYGAGRGALETGVVTVTIPENHTPGEIEAPSIWKLEFAPSPTRHMTLQSIEPLQSLAFFNRMNTEFRDAPDRDAFVFVHGFNVSFDAAAKRAAQLAFDMSYPGVPILYSWPSRARTSAYIADSAVVRLSGRRLAGFLQDIVDRSGARRIHLVAHSMGNRALTDALELLSLRNGLPKGGDPLFAQVIFAAPDVDAGLFQEMLPTMRPTAERMTLYASEADWALETSRHLHGNQPRAGQGGAETIVSPMIDSIDMSDLSEDFLAHGYFADHPSALADLMLMFWRNLPPDGRCGLFAEQSDLPVWRYRIGSCPAREIVPLLAHAIRGKINTMSDMRQLVGGDPSLPDAVRMERALSAMDVFMRD